MKNGNDMPTHAPKPEGNFQPIRMDHRTGHRPRGEVVLAHTSPAIPILLIRHGVNADAGTIQPSGEVDADAAFRADEWRAAAENTLAGAAQAAGRSKDQR